MPNTILFSVRSPPSPQSEHGPWPAKTTIVHDLLFTRPHESEDYLVRSLRAQACFGLFLGY